ncbi:MAG: hypothetical protein GEV11_12910 [Streptosporangiales bacterium]|nr:hypothetical protein [Streptosporangiales bacterium]
MTVDSGNTPPAGTAAPARPTSAAEARRSVIAIADALRREPETTRERLGRPDAPAYPHDPTQTDLFLAMLQDRLPVYVAIVERLVASAGTGTVTGNLVPVARATMDFWAEVLNAGITAFGSPETVMRLRTLLRGQGLGPQHTIAAVALYLRKEREAGRVPATLDAAGTAQLLLGACLDQAFFELVLGEDLMPDREESAHRLAAALRLG